ncbi:MAG: carboxylesterase/lipase family protein [Acidobacteria bacterium]|nr:carboxylesterase/lipase family protein [Acidobacteriota bacterium]
MAAPAALRATGTLETTGGRLRGYTVDGVQIFRGIPYAGAVEGAGRFLPPPPPPKWTGVRDATRTGPRCVQGPGNIFLSPVIGEYFAGGRPDRIELAHQDDSENCLVLNVLTPALRGKRPVMVYIHGGGFTGGSSALTLFADAFPRENGVVLVGVNHRINVFGYLYLGEWSERYADSGNAGQLDLVAALEWVRANISQFGGDPGNVTVFGESGGGAKIGALLAMPKARGLFHKAIVESGSQLRVSTREEAVGVARAALGKLGLNENQLDELPQVPAGKLLAAASIRGPVVDGRSIPRQTWDPDAPPEASGIPMLIGTCKDESTLFSLRDEELFRLDAAGLRRRAVESGISQADVDPLLAAYRKAHPSESPSQLYFRLSSDRGARWNALRQAERKIAQRAGNVFMYYFAWETPLAEGKIRAFHTAELPLAMRLVRFPESEGLSKNIAGAWASFARTGNPGWPAYALDGRRTMIFNAPESRVVEDPDGEIRTMLAGNPSGRPL